MNEVENEVQIAKKWLSFKKEYNQNQLYDQYLEVKKDLTIAQENRLIEAIDTMDQFFITF